jgi:hypothetical protein
MPERKIINGTINKLGKKYNSPIINRLQQNFIFNHDPSFKALHLIPINVADVQTEQVTDFFVQTLDLHYVKEGDTVIFLLHSEGWMHFLNFLDTSLKKYISHLNFNKIYYASEQLNYHEIPFQEKPAINHLFFISQDTWLPQYESAIKIPHTYELKDKIFLCYNNRTAPHRCQLVSLMNKHNMLSNSFVSLNVENAKFTLENDIFLTSEKKKEFLDHLPSNNLIIEPWNSSIHERSEYIKYARHHTRSLFSIVTETHWYEPELSFTEKIYRPLSFGHPFIVVGKAGYLKKLREFGFQTFNDSIDEKYDTIENPHQRIQAIISVMKKIYNMSEIERTKLWYSMNEVANFNLDVFYKKEFTKKVLLFDFIENYYNEQD